MENFSLSSETPEDMIKYLMILFVTILSPVKHIWIYLNAKRSIQMKKYFIILNVHIIGIKQ